jgi:hypothetical protein
MTTSSSMTTINLIPVSEKLARGNHTLWKAHILAVLCGVQLADFLAGTNKAPTETLKIKKASTEKGMTKDVEDVPNPAFDLWKAQEQQVLSYLLTLVFRDVLVQIAALPSVEQAWKHIETSFASQSRAWNRLLESNLTSGLYLPVIK